jgi:hypothetical protein
MRDAVRRGELLIAVNAQPRITLRFILGCEYAVPPALRCWCNLMPHNPLVNIG